VLEFALSATLLFMLFAGLADLTRMFYYARMVTSAAEAGVHYGMYTAANWTDYTGMQNAATASAGNVASLSAVATSYCACPGTTGTVACASTCAGSTTPEEYVQVTTTYPFAAVVAWPSLPSTFTISYTAVMPVQ
jgi:Flp pilus assembly protein TadG